MCGVSTKRIIDLHRRIDQLETVIVHLAGLEPTKFDHPTERTMRNLVGCYVKITTDFDGTQIGPENGEGILEIQTVGWTDGWRLVDQSGPLWNFGPGLEKVTSIEVIK